MPGPLTFVIDLIYYFEVYIIFYFSNNYGRGSKNNSSYFDERIHIEHETDKLMADNSFDECIYIKDDDMCA